MAREIPAIEEPAEGKIVTVVADDLEIRGTIRFKTSVMLKGLFEGEIFSEGLLVVGPTAKVTATINTDTLISHGEITGDITARKQVVLRSTAINTGDIKTPFIMIENGAVFNGTCIMEREQAAETAEIVVPTPEPVKEQPNQFFATPQEPKKKQHREKAAGEVPTASGEKGEEPKPPSGELL